MLSSSSHCQRCDCHHFSPISLSGHIWSNQFQSTDQTANPYKTPKKAEQPKSNPKKHFKKTQPIFCLAKRKSGSAWLRSTKTRQTWRPSLVTAIRANSGQTNGKNGKRREKTTQHLEEKNIFLLAVLFSCSRKTHFETEHVFLHNSRLCKDLSNWIERWEIWIESWEIRRLFEASNGCEKRQNRSPNKHNPKTKPERNHYPARHKIVPNLFLKV